VTRGAACLACGRPLDRHAATCPRCGAAQPHKRLGGTVGLGVMLAALVGLLVASLLGRDA
jgi:uncharacterized paraquat-inducible protein A